MSADQSATVLDADVVGCPTCNATLIFRRSGVPHMDDCGFESYNFMCGECGVTLAGIVDPFEDLLLLSAVPA